MQIQWDLLAIGLITFSVITGLQKAFLSRSIERIIRDDTWAQAMEDWAKLTRQDMAGVLLLLGITNGLLERLRRFSVFRH